MVDSPLASLRGWMLQNDRALAMFYEIPDGVEVPEHAHGAQWGVVLEGYDRVHDRRRDARPTGPATRTTCRTRSPTAR